MYLPKRTNHFSLHVLVYEILKYTITKMDLHVFVDTIFTLHGISDQL